MSVYIFPPVSVTTLPPVGGATSAKQDLQTAELQSINTELDNILAKVVRFKKNGVATDVNYDTATPTNSEALPVNIVTVNGQGISTTVDLTGAQINVQLSDRGASPDSVLIGDGTDYLAISSSGEALIYASGDAISTDNSSVIALAGGATFTGASISIINHATVNINFYSDVATAANGLKAQFSQDGITWDHEHTFTIPAGVAVGYNLAAEGNFFRVVVVNGAAAQATMRLQTILKKSPITTSTYALDYALNDYNVAQTVKAVLSAKNPGGSYVSIDCTTGGNLKASIEEVDAAVVFSTKPKAITASFDEKLTLTVVDTFTAPANAVGGKIYAKTGNPGNVVFKQGGVATTTSGIFLEAGRSEDLTNGSDVSVVSESGTNAVSIIWNVQA